MRILTERLIRLRWMTMPLAAYLVITLALPLANAGRISRDFVHHASWVLGGCLAMVAVALTAGLLIELVVAFARAARNMFESRRVGGR